MYVICYNLPGVWERRWTQAKTEFEAREVLKNILHRYGLKPEDVMIFGPDDGLDPAEFVSEN